MGQRRADAGGAGVTAELRAYEYMRRAFIERGWPVTALHFEPELVSLGLVMDKELGNLVKANRFGHVRNACHGTRMLGFDEWRAVYGTAPIDLAETRWEFMNTLFSLSEACLYIQLVELLDAGKLEPGLGYQEPDGTFLSWFGLGARSSSRLELSARAL